MPRRAEPLAVRIWKHVNVHADGCWLWTASTRKGYGQIWTSMADEGPRRIRAAHRAMYELVRGPVPDGLDLDHLCRVLICVNPDHLEPVTRKENVLRGDGPAARNARRTHCLNAHELEQMPSGDRRWCPTCATERGLERPRLLVAV